jgi:hypothetical protein
MKNCVNFSNHTSSFLFSGFSHILRSKFIISLYVLFLLLPLSCQSDEEEKIQSELETARITFDTLMNDPNNMVITFPDEDPGIPIYARVGPILNQFFVAGDQLVIPFYRNPLCIPDSFNLLNYYDPPTAFGCELMVQGRFVIEKDAEEGQFPIMAHTTGSEVPVWIVDWTDFQSLRANGAVTIVDLEALEPIKAITFQFEEYLLPRINEHQVIIEAEGTVPDTDQKFLFHLIHEGDQIQSIALVIE